MRAGWVVLSFVLVTWAGAAQAADIGQIKVVQGAVSIERGGQSLRGDRGSARAGLGRRANRQRRVGRHHDDRQLAAVGRPEQRACRSTATSSTRRPSQGRFDASLQRGTLAVVSGRLAKQSPDAMTVRTPSAILGVRGTEFVVSVR